MADNNNDLQRLARETFLRLNRELFNNEIPNNYTIIFTPLEPGQELGETHPHRGEIWIDQIYLDALRENRKAAFEDFRRVLLHEMVHALLYERGCQDWDKHGEKFNTIAKQVGAPTW